MTKYILNIIGPRGTEILPTKHLYTDYSRQAFTKAQVKHSDSDHILFDTTPALCVTSPELPRKHDKDYTQQTIAVQPETLPLIGRVHSRDLEDRNEVYISFSVFTCLCCNPIFGLIGLLVGCSAKSALRAGHVERAKCLSQAGLVISALGIVMTFLVVIIYDSYDIITDGR